MSVMATGVQTPRISSYPDFGGTAGTEAVELAAMAGLILDPSQEFVLVNALGERAAGKWASFEVGVCEPRQNGKGAILEARELSGLFLFGERLIIHSAHEFATATEARLRMEAILEATPDLSRLVRSINRSHGAEGFTLFSGQRLLYRTRTKGGGRGFTGDTLMLDEAMFAQEAFIGALLPTLAAQSMYGNPQVWYMGSAVDQQVHEHGLVFARIRERGLRGGDPSLAYFEWSVDARDEDGKPLQPDAIPDDLARSPEAWAQANPGLGIRISTDHIEKELRSMGPREFAVERLGVGDWPATDGTGNSPISVDDWKALADPTLPQPKMLDPVCFAFDVSPDRADAAIWAAGRRDDDLFQVEDVDHRPGTGWIVQRIIELNGTHNPTAILCDAAGPAASLIRELEDAGIVVEAVSAKDHANACGMIFDLVEQRRLRHLGSPEIVAALKGAAKRPLGDAWAWSRKSSSVNITSLVAATLALWAASTAGPAEPWAGGW